VVPWSRLVERLRPFYPKGERGRPPIGLERMLRLYFLQQWYGLAADSDGSRPGFRDDLARQSDLMSLAVPR